MNIEDQITLSLNTPVELNAEQFISLIVIPNGDEPFIQFSYQNVSTLTLGAWIGIIVAVLFVYITLMMVIICLIAKCIAKRKIAEIMPPPKKPVEMANLNPAPTY